MKNTANNSAVIVINENQVKDIIHNIPNGVFFGMEYDYRHPKCGKCGCKSVKFERGVKVCHKCGGKVEFSRVTIAQKGVFNPANVTAPGQGAFKGISAEDAEIKYNLFKHYDRNAKNENGSRGDYRQAGFEKIRKLKVNGKKYVVK